MIWQKYLIVIMAFYFFALLQNNFITNFIFLGTVPNLVFALFLIIVFFLGKNVGYEVVFLSLIAGFFLDIFSYSYIGFSIISLLVIGFLLKKIQSALKNTDEEYPFSYFLPLYLSGLAVYESLIHASIIFDLRFVIGIAYSLIFASGFFYVYKKFLVRFLNGKNLQG